MKKYINYDFYKEEIPIQDVCELLGLEQESHNKYHSPLHTDVHASLTIDTNENSKYYNKWRDWSFQEGGTVIDLVLATKFGITPTEYWKNPEKYKDQHIKCIEFLNQYYPGGIVYYNEGDNKVLNENNPPIIPKEILKAIGEKYNPLTDYHLTTDSYSDRAEILLDKFQKYEKNLLMYANRVLGDFPELDIKAQRIIVKKTMKQYNIIHEYTEKVQDFYFKAMEIEYENIDFVKEEQDLFKENSISIKENDFELEDDL